MNFSAQLHGVKKTLSLSALPFTGHSSCMLAPTLARTVPPTVTEKFESSKLLMFRAEDNIEGASAKRKKRKKQMDQETRTRIFCLSIALDSGRVMRFYLVLFDCENAGLPERILKGHSAGYRVTSGRGPTDLGKSCNGFLYYTGPSL